MSTNNSFDRLLNITLILVIAATLWMLLNGGRLDNPFSTPAGSHSLTKAQQINLDRYRATQPALYLTGSDVESIFGQDVVEPNGVVLVIAGSGCSTCQTRELEFLNTFADEYRKYGASSTAIFLSPSWQDSTHHAGLINIYKKASSFSDHIKVVNTERANNTFASYNMPLWLFFKDGLLTRAVEGISTDDEFTRLILENGLSQYSDGLVLDFRLLSANMDSPAFDSTDVVAVFPSINEEHGNPKYHIVNIWATWCAPCIQEMASLNELAKREEYSVTAITNDDSTRVLRFIDASSLDNITFTLVHSDVNPYNARVIPTTHIYTNDGSYLGTIQGARDWSVFSAEALQPSGTSESTLEIAN